MGKILSELREKAWDINKELEEAEEAETMRKGCRMCGSDNIGAGAYRRTITVAGMPFSVGSMAETFIVCVDCQNKIHRMLKGE